MSLPKFGKWVAVRQRPLGGGGNGIVYLVKDSLKREDKQYALKQLKSFTNLGRREREKRQKRFLGEIEALKMISNHPGVLPLIDESTKELWYVMPLAKSVDKLKK